MYYRYVKRLQDIVLSFLAVVVFSPVIAMTALLVRLKLGSPVIFKQKRPGKDNHIFTMYKFRTMNDRRDENGNLLPDSVRLTSFGKKLRSTSLDELPELFNILKGDMSIIGPRPLLVKDMVFFDENQMRRQTVRPGLSGLAQINGRNNILWEDKLEYDLQYIERITFWGDWKIIFQTVFKAFRRDGIATDGMDTAEDLGDYLLREKKIDEEYYQKKILKYKELIGVK
jgi:sugar transferase